MQMHLKNVVRSLVIGGVAVLLSAPCYAFTSSRVATTQARASVSGGSVAMTVSLHKMSDGSADTQINWANVPAGSGWTLADDYIQLDSTIANVGSGIQT